VKLLADLVFFLFFGFVSFFNTDNKKMADVREMRIFCAEQIIVPDELPTILKNYSKEVIRSNPGDLVDFSLKYFEDMLKKREEAPGNDATTVPYPEVKKD